MELEHFYKSCAKNFSSYLPYLLQKKSLPSYLPPLRICLKRQQYLQSLAAHGRHSYKTLWPSLQVICTWSSGPCEKYAQQLAAEVGSSVALMENNYSATERMRMVLKWAVYCP